MRFIWDRDNIAHIARHNISPREVEETLAEFLIEIEHQVVDGEVRFRDAGVTLAGRFLEVVTTDVADCIRVVTAFDASPHTIQEYRRQR